MNKKDKTVEKKVQDVIAAYKSLDKSIKSDVQGSYTGVPLGKDQEPVQDADDL